MHYIMFLLALLFTNVANAMNCQKLPDCEKLGYSKEDVKDCAENGYLNCPFDQDYKVCVQYNCEALGFTQSDKTSWCADLIECKGNQKMTLCQKPCLATNYQELKELASSGKCKVVTMRNDIIIPQNEGITLHADTIIDGGNHTITSSGNIKNLTIFSMNDKTGMKNLKLHHTQTQTQEEFSLLKALIETNNVSLENMDISVSSNDNSGCWAPTLRYGVYDIRGKFVLDSDGDVPHFGGLVSVSANFSDAQVSINIEGESGDIFVSSNLIFTNATLDTENIEGVSFTHTGSATFINSQANLKATGLFFGTKNAEEKQKIVLEGSNLTTSVKDYINYASVATITLKGTQQNPSVLNLAFSSEDLNDGQTNIESTNTTDMLVLNGVTYRPKQLATTKLSEIESSQNWIKQ